SERPPAGARTGRKRLLRHDGGGPRHPASLIDWPDLEYSIPKHGLLSREGWPPSSPTTGTPTRPTTRVAPAARDPLVPKESEPQPGSESRKRNRPGPKSEARGNPHAKFFAPAWEYGPRTDYTGCGFVLPLSGYLGEESVPTQTDPFPPLSSPHSGPKQVDSISTQDPLSPVEDLHAPSPGAPSQEQEDAPGAEPSRPPPPEDTQEKAVELLETNASEEGQATLQQLLRRYDGLWRGERRGCAQAMSHRISVTSDRPIVTRPRSFTPAQQRVLQEELRSMLDAGVIEPSNSPHASEVVLVRKKDGGWRVCIDFRQVNDLTVPDQYPLPTSSVKMEADSIPYTAFRCTGGLYQFKVMPFGLRNAPATFQRMVDCLLGDLRYGGVLVYLDDILVHGATEEGTLTLLAEVFRRLSVAGLTLNLKKCTFFPKRLHYLGQVIEEGLLLPDPGRVQQLQAWKVPRTLTELRSLLGLFAYYQ
ncbi:MAG: uncharacterized protein KVP18_005183, partial [Porospora cf. gigantea A]|uniref:uncharacterized protein n=1 Tax=Porospora cf. gigantea A TaxID=2853593 RepID=UPI00355A66DA